MFLKQIVMNKFLNLASIVLAFALMSFGLTTPASAQKMRLNVGCPSLGSPNIGSYTIDQLNELCHNNTGQTSVSSSSGSSPAAEVSSAENGASLRVRTY